MWNLLILAALTWAIPQTGLSPSQFLWENRLIIIFEDDTHTESQRKLFEGLEAEIEDRDLRLFRIPQGSHPWRKKYSVGEDEFRLLLVGKDGGVKRRVEEPIEPAQLFQQIDQMPMRRREMRERR